ncbi:MAG: RtcB family protein [Pseudomonadota bacterium]
MPKRAKKQQDAVPDRVTGQHLLAWGHEAGPWFKAALAAAETVRAEGGDLAAIQAAVAAQAPPPIARIPLQDGVPYAALIEAETPAEEANVAAVRETMDRLMRTPTVVGGAVMPDACPAGSVGTIPVGGVVAAKGAIHPGMHSADICCSVAISVIGDVDPRRVLDAGQGVTHFGGGGRAEGRRHTPPEPVLAGFAANPYLAKIGEAAVSHFATQGDGNHFLYVGRLASTGEVALVTHHGSRKPGAMLYKQGMALAEAHRAKHAPEVDRANAWIPADSHEGALYWDALHQVRAWTKANHTAIHDLTLAALGIDAPRERFWNEHNFVFRRGDLFLHGKGATPAWGDYADDASGQVLIPLNMAEPVLIARGRDRAEALGFCPHGAGRNMSRTAHAKRVAGVPPAEVVRRETEGIDARFWTGDPDLSELPSAYKRADAVVAQIERFGLADVVDRVEPYGCLMAGDWARAKRAWADKRRARGTDRR